MGLLFSSIVMIMIMIMTMIMTMRISSIVIEVIGVFYFFNEEILHIKKAQKSTKST